MPEASAGKCVTMVNGDLRSAPVHSLSRDLQVHWYTHGDEKEWLMIHERADVYNEITPQLFSDQFADSTLDLSGRQFYLLDMTGSAIATGTAWAASHGKFSGFGRPHWLAVLPQFQRCGVGTMLMGIIWQRLLELGHTRAFLTTSTSRPRAIRLYERFGFRIVNAEE